MKMFNYWKYSIAIFMAIVLIVVNFSPKSKIEQVPQIEKTQQVKNDDLKVQLKDGVVLGKYYTDKGYYIIVWDADYDKPIEFDMDFGEWSNIHFGDVY